LGDGFDKVSHHKNNSMMVDRLVGPGPVIQWPGPEYASAFQSRVRICQASMPKREGTPSRARGSSCVTSSC
jgi:hypothetical protein